MKKQTMLSRLSDPAYSLFGVRLPVGKSFILLGYGGPVMVDEAQENGWNLWSVTSEREGEDEFTEGWSGCDPCQIYFRENVENKSKPRKKIDI